MTVSDEARALARGAKAELQRRGRFVGNFFEPAPGADRYTDQTSCRVCVLGAVSAADGDLTLTLAAPSVAAGELLAALTEQVGDGLPPAGGADYEYMVETVGGWHDADTTSDDDVYRMLDSIADAA